MYDESFLELEEIQGDEKWSFEVLESKYLTCKGAKKWEHAEAYSNGMRIYHPNRVGGWILTKLNACTNYTVQRRQYRLCYWTRNALKSLLDMYCDWTLLRLG